MTDEEISVEDNLYDSKLLNCLWQKHDKDLIRKPSIYCKKLCKQDLIKEPNLNNLSLREYFTFEYKLM